MGFNITAWKVPFVVIIVGVAFTMLACSYVRGWEEGHNMDELADRSETRVVAVENSFNSMLTLSEHVRAFIRNELVIETSDVIKLNEFTGFVNSYLLDYKSIGMQAVAWLPHIPAGSFEKFYKMMQDDNGQMFQVTKYTGEVIDDFSDGQDIYPLYYAGLQLNSNLRRGVDIASKPTHQEHMKLAAESNHVLVDLYLDEQSHQVVSVFLPVFDHPESENRILLGFVFSQWDVGEMLEYSISQFPLAGIDYFLDDERGVHIYSHASRSRAIDELPNRDEIVWTQEFEVAEHIWKLSAAPAPLFKREHPVLLAWAVLFIGLFVTLSTAYYVRRVTIQRHLIETEVWARTRELVYSQNSLAKTQQIAQLGGWEWDVVSGELIWSDEVYRVFGYEPGQIKADYDRFMRAIHPDDRDLVINGVDGALKGKEYNLIHRIILPDGEIRFVHELGAAEFDQDGNPVRMVGTVQNVTQQRRAERRLHRLAMALSETAESVVITNREGVIRYVNHAFEKLSGYSAEEALGKHPNLVKSGEHPDEYYRLMWEKIEEGSSWFGSFKNRNKNGDIYEVEQTISPIRDDQGGVNGYVAVQRDVTGEREKLAKMEHTQRLESLGVLAGGIAHDFNNLLTTIMGNASLAKRKISVEQSEAATHLTRIETASERAAELCRQMLAYSGQGDYLREWFDLNERIHDMTELLQVSMSKRVSLELKMEPCSYQMYGDKSQVQQVVMNLVINASEAIEEAGRGGKVKLLVELNEMMEGDFRNCLYHEQEKPEPGYYICLTVSDDGCGMDEETRLKIFDPFFTTKFTGRGLGTSAILGIVQSHKGAISFESEPDKGTTFKVYFPCEEQAVAMESPAVSSSEEEDSEVWKGKACILLIDDEADILESTGAMLDDIGVHVLSAQNATHGIDAFREHYAVIKLVLVDMTMPEMDGLTCVKKLMEIDPEAQVVLSSGYSESVLMDQTSDLNLAGYLQKPYSQDELYQLVRSILNQ